LIEAVAESIKDPKAIAALRAQGIEPKSSRAADLAVLIQDQFDLHSKLSKQMHLDMTQ
jgi:hypothetical protein